MKRTIRTGLAAAACTLPLLPAVLSLFYADRLADRYYVRHGEALQLSTALPITAQPADSVTEAALTQSTASKVALRLFGIFPIKNVEIQQTEEVMLVPCGQAFGIRMLMDGIMVIGFGDVVSADGSCCPARDAGLQEGDIITETNQTPITSTEDFKAEAAEGTAMTLTVLRGEETLTMTLTPVYVPSEDGYLTGLWVRDSAAGIGTLTYYEPSTGYFGGLGHPICDPDTGEQIPLASGEADAVVISGAVKGQPGMPGQLQGYFSAGESIGSLLCNSRCGIFGTLNEAPSDIPAVPMGLKQEIVLGEATLLTTVSGDEPEAFTIEITSLDYSKDTQNMIIEVTDEALLSRTGGIVQGMSGSPILQNGKLVGAVTHVFVGEPTMGYGIFAENMYEFTQSISSGNG